MKPAMIALSGANPGLLPVAFLSGGKGYGEPEPEDFTDGQLAIGFFLVASFWGIAALNLYLIGALW